MKHTCTDCGEYKELDPVEDSINKQTYYICDECNDIRHENFIGEYY